MDDLVNTRLMLITPAVADPSAFAPKLAAACAAGDIAALVLRLSPSDERSLVVRAKPLVALAQEAGAAVLIEGLPDVVGKSGADGLHAVGIAHVRDAVERFRPEKIVGAGGLRARDDAMHAGEIDVDYLMFGDAGADGGRPPFESVIERVQWWAEVFQPPCVGVSPDLEGIAKLAGVKADFVALDGWLWEEADIAGTIRAAEEILARSRVPA
jgi:thiamine-phosphate pyrophosphorylase